MATLRCQRVGFNVLTEGTSCSSLYLLLLGTEGIVGHEAIRDLSSKCLGLLLLCQFRFWKLKGKSITSLEEASKCFLVCESLGSFRRNERS